MKAFQNVDGGVLTSVREYDIAPGTAVYEGQVVQLAAGLVVPAIAAQTGAVLGVAAENHGGKEDGLNLRANGPRILVYDGPGGIYECPAPEIEATGGSETAVNCTTLAAFANGDFTGGYLVLVKKAPGGTGVVGTSRRITNYTYTSSGTLSTFTVEAGAAAVAGDVYALYPPVGFSKGNLDGEGRRLVLTATADLALRVVGRDEAGGALRVMAAKHLLG